MFREVAGVKDGLEEIERRFFPVTERGAVPGLKLFVSRVSANYRQENDWRA